jgi:hypothetical protein
MNNKRLKAFLQCGIVAAGIAIILINLTGVLSTDNGMALLVLAVASLSGLTIGSILRG